MEKKDEDDVSVCSVISDESELRSKGFSLRRIMNLIKSRSLDFEPKPCKMSLDDISNKNTTMLTDTSGTSLVRECQICFTEQPDDNFPEIMTCQHRYCLDCLRTYLKLQIGESRIDISCLKCPEIFHPSDVRDILQDDVLMEKYEAIMLRRELTTDQDARWCPAPDCGYVVIATGCTGCPKLTCGRPGCDTEFCYLCKELWHPGQTCDTTRAKRDVYQNDNIKPCPECGSLIEKEQDGSCNHMNCPTCGEEFCWLCLKKITELHYLSPSGCTYFGQKRWSEGKKKRFQLAALVAAPILIPVIAGLAAPAMLVSIPRWVGREIRTKYKTSSALKKNLAIAGGVIASLPIAPVVAGLIVGIGVPAVFAYTYGVFMPKFLRKHCKAD